MVLTGAQIVIESLVAEGIDTIFGYPGGTILNIYDELYKNSDRIHHILTAHEQGAAHAADGYSRATGRVGVCFATSGPGATNLVTGIATAYMDSIPMVALTCNVGSNLLGRDSFQEIDVSGITMPITKHNYIVKDVTELAQTIKDAFTIASSGRPGPVLIDIPKDVTALKTEYIPATKPSAEFGKRPPIPKERYRQAANLIMSCKKPLIIAGGGIISAGASKELLEFATKIDSPVASTLMGTGGFPAENQLYTGMIGMHGTKASNLGSANCDLLICIGARFSDRVISDGRKFARNATILHIDIDPAEIGKNVPTDFELIGDAKTILDNLLLLVEPKSNIEWHNMILRWKSEFPKQDSVDALLNPQFIMEKVHEATNGKAIIVTEVGQHQMWACQFYNYETPRTFVSSGGLGTMGFGTGASIGAQIGMPDKQVISIAGDGSFRMNCNELATISCYKVPVIIVIMNNSTLGMVRQWQTLFYDKRYSETNLDNRGPDFKKLAEAYDIKGYQVSTKEAFESAINEAVRERKPAVIDVKINTDEFVFPMVAPGAAIQDLISKK